MKCTHCTAELIEDEIAKNDQTARVHGINLVYCRLCWDAWGMMTYGWQAGVLADRRVSFTDRAQTWEARREGPTFHGQWSDTERRRVMAEIEPPLYRVALPRRPWRRWISLQAHKV